MTAVPLRRNRDFVLLQAGQLLSNLGSRMTSIAYPLLVLGMTGSPAKAGFVAFARILPVALFTLPAGVAADKWNRRRIMIAADAVRVAAVSVLVATIWLDSTLFWPVAVIAFVEGVGVAFFTAAYPGAMRSVVSVEQLPDAISTQTGRLAVVQVAGSPLGGALYTVGRSVPFVVDVFSYLFSAASLMAMRSPFQLEREHDPSPLRSRLVEGLRFVWSRPFLRTCALVFGLLNFVGQGLLFLIVIVGVDQGLSGGAVGLLVSVFFGAALVGTFISPFVRRRLPVHGVLVLELWAWVCCVAFLVWPSVYVLTASVVPVGLAIASTDSVVHGYRIAMTPDRLLGRAESAWTTIALVITPLGPLVLGWLVTAASARAAVGLCAFVALALALWATFSPSIRTAPSLDQLAGETRTSGACSLREVDVAVALERDPHPSSRPNPPPPRSGHTSTAACSPPRRVAGYGVTVIQQPLSSILEGKSGDVLEIDGDATVFEAIAKMVDANVGSLLVTDEGEIVGIMTERDYLRRVTLQGRTDKETPVRDIMSSPVYVVTPETQIDECMALMTDRRIRHVPVVDEGRVVGVVSIGDLVKYTSKQQAFEIKYLTDYITGR